MKKTLIFCFSIFVITLPLHAQLKVKANGRVKVGAGTLDPGASFEVQENNKTTECRIFATSANIARLWVMNQSFAYGFGTDAGSNGNIFSNVNSPTSIMTFNTSGCFGINYSPSTTYKLYIGGSAFCTGVWQTSDIHLKRNIKPIENSLEVLQKLNGKTYYFSRKEFNMKGADSTDKMSYGFIAQEIQKVLPDLVQANDDSVGTLAINYSGFIPIIVEALKSQQSVIKNLEMQIELLKIASASPTTTHENNKSSKLLQNVPNPFVNDTEIGYIIDDLSSNAFINIYNLQGLEIKSFNINSKGQSKVIVKGSDLRPGIYFYCLIIDEKLIDTKQMILTK